MSFLHEPGDLARTPLAAVLLEALNLRATGVLAVQHGGGTSRLFIQQGKPVGAQVAVGVRPLGQLLLQEGVIDIDALSKSLAAMAETRKPQGDILVEMGAVRREVVDQALAEQQAGYFGLIAALEGGTYAFDATAPIPPWAGRSPLSPLRTIVDALERPQASALVGSALQPVAASAIRLASSYRDVAVGFRWGAGELALLSRLEAPVTLEAFFAPAEVAPERARAMLAALLLLGLAVPAGTRDSDTLAGLEVDLGTTRPTGSSPAPPARRSDPAEARARRQRLLQQAMRNMGVGPFAGRSTPPPTAAGGPGAGARPEAGTPAPRPAPPPPDSPEAALRKALLAAAPQAKEPDLFARLGLSPGAGKEEVKQAFLSLARQFHPDRFAAPSLSDMAETVKDFFTAVNEAYETLSDDRRRNAYLAHHGEVSADRSEAAQIDFRKGDACLRTRDFVRARGFFEAALRTDQRAEYKAALALAILSDPAARERERARALAEEALSDPSCDRAAYVAGLLARDDRDDARAEKHFRAAVAANPRNAEAVRELRILERKRAR
ncbi:MAG TPA: DnaJ domain-containing protein [Anaeromyxobacter sp.]|nr:DnaJ domain-containing protein [Anaeromyxobacter sp.]